jgi:hypothetical protein
MVYETRRVLRVSQKDLASNLEQLGLHLDASAISRVEKGTRALRLSEAATIASTLGFALADVEAPSDPVEIFAIRSKMVENGVAAAEEGMRAFVEGLEEMSWLIDQAPHVLAALGGDGLDAPTSFVSYIEWLTARWLSDGPSGFVELLGPEVEAARTMLTVMASSIVREPGRIRLPARD